MTKDEGRRTKIHLFSRVAGLPFAPMLAWPIGVEGRWLAIGLGDLLLATAFPLAVSKAFGPLAGGAALAIGLIVLTTLLALPVLGVAPAAFPVMIILGPLMTLQYLYWRRRDQERTTWQYLQAELPLRHLD